MMKKRLESKDVNGDFTKDIKVKQNFIAFGFIFLIIILFLGAGIGVYFLFNSKFLDRPVINNTFNDSNQSPIFPSDNNDLNITNNSINDQIISPPIIPSTPSSSSSSSGSGSSGGGDDDCNVSSCVDNPCFEPICNDGCSQIPVANGAIDESCNGVNFCDGLVDEGGVCDTEELPSSGIFNKLINFIEKYFFNLF